MIDFQIGIKSGKMPKLKIGDTSYYMTKEELREVMIQIEEELRSDRPKKIEELIAPKTEGHPFRGIG